MKLVKQLIGKERDCVPVDFNDLPEDLASIECFCLICERLRAMGAQVAYICNACLEKKQK